METIQKTSSILILVAVALLAWNSVIARYAFVHQTIDPDSFALIRLASGAVFLGLILVVRGRVSQISTLNLNHTLWSALALAVYMVGFAYAHTKLDAGAGALIQFAVVQIVMFWGAILLKEDVPRARVIGAVIAFVGLSVMLWPVGQAVPESIPVLAMICAATGWAIYSVLGREVKLAIAATGTNFMLALPISAVLILLLPHNMPMLLTAPGIWLAVLSGAITSGLSYSFWYYVLPRTRTSIAGVAQLLIPAFTMTGGIIILDETLTIRFAVSFFIVAFGVALSLGIVPVGRGHHSGQPR
ncbi:DMT family transporter [Alphaproteobacteria bacterium]|nr:DMT family transporter [Alphaproteobacteria bacterium]